MSAQSLSVCPKFHRAVELVGKRWTGAILRILQLKGRERFNALAAAIPDISDRMLSERLRELESEGIINRHVIPETPVRVEYELTEKGRGLEDALGAIARWAQLWMATELTEAGEENPSRTAQSVDPGAPS